MAELVFYGLAAIEDCAYQGAVICVCYSSTFIFDPITSKLRSQLVNSRICRKNPTDAVCFENHAAIRADLMYMNAFFDCVGENGFDYPFYRVIVEGAQYQLFVLWDRMLFYSGEKPFRTDFLSNTGICMIEQSLFVLSFEASYQMQASDGQVCEELFNLLNFLTFSARSKSLASLEQCAASTAPITPAAETQVLHGPYSYRDDSYAYKIAETTSCRSSSKWFRRGKAKRSCLPSDASVFGGSSHYSLSLDAQETIYTRGPAGRYNGSVGLSHEYQIGPQIEHLDPSPAQAPTVYSLSEALALIGNKKIRAKASGKRVRLAFRVNNGLLVDFKRQTYKITELAGAYSDGESAAVRIEPLGQEFHMTKNDSALLQKCFEVIHRAETYGVRQ